MCEELRADLTLRKASFDSLLLDLNSSFLIKKEEQNFVEPTVSYLSEFMADSLDVQPLPNKCFFSAALAESGSQSRSDLSTSTRSACEGDLYINANSIRTRTGEKFYFSASSLKAPFELSRLLLSLNGEDCTTCKDPIRDVENGFDILPIRAQADSFIAHGKI